MPPYLPTLKAGNGPPTWIWFNNLRSYGTPDYYVQQLFSLNKGTDVVPVTLNKEAVTGQDGCFATAALDKNTNELIIKIVNTGKDEQKADFSVNGVNAAANGELTTLQSDDLNSVNSFEAPLAVSPVKSAVTVKDNHIKLTLKPYSFNVIRVKMDK